VDARPHDDPPAPAPAAREAIDGLGALATAAPRWYREGRHAELLAACAQAEAAQASPLPEGLALWQALATWYVDPAAALARLRALAGRRGLRPPQPPAPPPRLGEDLYLLAALYRSELAMLEPAPRLTQTAAAIEAHLAAPGLEAEPVLAQLGGVTAAIAALSLEGRDPPRLAALSARSLELVARLEDRHSLCSAVALARWPLLRGEAALARETCELIVVGLLAGDDAQMPLAHGWLMAVQDEAAMGDRFDLLHAWQDGSIDRDAIVASPIAPALLGAIALLDAQAPAALATDVHEVVLEHAGRFSPFERWLAYAARCARHLRDGDVPAARAVLRLLDAPALPGGPLLAAHRALLAAQCRWLGGEPPVPAAAHRDGGRAEGLAAAWPGPVMAERLLAWATGRATPSAAELSRCDEAFARQGLVWPLFTAPATARAALACVDTMLPQAAPASGWCRALRRRLERHASGEPLRAQTAGAAAVPAANAAAAAAAPAPAETTGATVEIGLLDGLAITVAGEPLALGRKPPRRLLELVALLALRWPAEVPPAQLADALYPELEGDAARRALDTALYRLRRLLPAGSLRRGAVGVALDARGVRVRRAGPPARWLPEFERPWAEAARRSGRPDAAV
jgi:hypothetical protein